MLNSNYYPNYDKEFQLFPNQIELFCARCLSGQISRAGKRSSERCQQYHSAAPRLYQRDTSRADRVSACIDGTCIVRMDTQRFRLDVGVGRSGCNGFVPTLVSSGTFMSREAPRLTYHLKTNHTSHTKLQVNVASSRRITHHTPNYR